MERDRISFRTYFFVTMSSCVVLLCCCALFGVSRGSAIPVWEFLSRQEKMSFLYSIFANLVDDFCDEKSTLKDCNKELLRYGLNTLKIMHEDLLDITDPYQKDSHHIIWERMLKGHPLAQSPPKEKPSTTSPSPNSYDDRELGELGSEAAASADLDNVYRVTPPEGFVVNVEDDTPVDNYPPNIASIIKTITAPVAEEELLDGFEYSDSNRTVERVPLTGPVVTKVYPDGTPVEEEVPAHQDEDLRQHLLAQVPIPELI